MNNRQHPPTGVEALTHSNDTANRFGWSINDWAKAAGISRASVYEIMNAGQIETVKFGGKRLVLTHPRDWLNSLRTAA